MKRAFVVTLEVDDNQPDAQLAIDILDDLVDAGYTVITVNPFGGERIDTAAHPAPTGFGSFFKPSL